MRRMSLLRSLGGFLVFLTACASTPKPAKVTVALVDASEERKVMSANGFVIRYNRVKVKDRAEALQILESRREFLLNLFENSLDPYFGTSRWSVECLSQNKIGPSASEQGSNEFVSRLNVSEKFNFGECGSEAYRAILLNFFCPTESAVVEVVLRPETRKSTVPESARIECESPLRLTF